MFSIVSRQRVCHLPVIRIFRDVRPELLFSTSSPVRVGGSGRFRKMKPVTNAFLSRSPVKKSKETGSNPSFDRDYLDKTVDTLLQGERRNRYRFLHKIPPPAHQPDKKHSRDEFGVQMQLHLCHLALHGRPIHTCSCEVSTIRNRRCLPSHLSF